MVAEQLLYHRLILSQFSPTTVKSVCSNRALYCSMTRDHIGSQLPENFIFMCFKQKPKTNPQKCHHHELGKDKSIHLFYVKKNVQIYKIFLSFFFFYSKDLLCRSYIKKFILCHYVGFSRYIKFLCHHVQLKIYLVFVQALSLFCFCTPLEINTTSTNSIVSMQIPLSSPSLVPFPCQLNCSLPNIIVCLIVSLS